MIRIAFVTGNRTLSDVSNIKSALGSVKDGGLDTFKLGDLVDMSVDGGGLGQREMTPLSDFSVSP